MSKNFDPGDVGIVSEWIRQEIGRISDEYWKAFFSERGRAKKEGDQFRWRAGCRVREFEYGAYIQWFYIVPIGKGKTAQKVPLLEDKERTALKRFARMRDLMPSEKAVVRSVKSYAKPYADLGKRIQKYNRIGKAVMKTAESMGMDREDVEAELHSED